MANGQKVVLTGERRGRMARRYPWYKAARLMGFLDAVPGLKLSELARRCYLRLNKVPHFRRNGASEWKVLSAGQNAWIDSYGLLAIRSCRFLLRADARSNE